MSGGRFALGELAARIGGRVHGDPALVLSGVRALEDAGPADLSLLTQARYRPAALASRAGALLAAPSWAGDADLAARNLLLADDPALALARILGLFHPPPAPRPGVHPTAVVEEGAVIDPGARIGAYAVVGEGSAVAAGAVLEAHVVVGKGCTVGPGAVLHPHVVLYDGVEVGERSVVHAGTVLGADGFGYATHQGVHHKVPQVGRVVVEADVEIGANSAVDRATLGETRIGAGTKVDNLVQVGHNVRVGKASILCGQAGIAGSTRLGDGVVLAGQAGVAGHLEVGSHVQVAAKSALLHSVDKGRFAGIPAVELGAWRRQAVALPRLSEILRRLKALENALGQKTDLMKRPDGRQGEGEER